MLKGIGKTCVILAITMLLVGTNVFSCISKNVDSGDFERYYEKQKTEKVMEDLTSTPLFFTQNQGQFPEGVLFQAQRVGILINLYSNKLVTIFCTISEKESTNSQRGFRHLSGNSFTDSSPGAINEVQISSFFIGANKNVIVTGEDMLSHYNHYFIGRDPEKWHTDVPNFKRVWYQNIYPCIDLKFYGEDTTLKYDFIIHPGGDINDIAIKYEGIENVIITSSGDLEIQTKSGCFYEHAPLIYQQINGVRRTISGRYQLLAQNMFGFTVDEHYNASYPLIIDPKLDYSTYLGDTYDDKGYSIAVDEYNNAYVTGFTNSLHFPTTDGAYDTDPNGGGDVFITKLAPSTGGVNSLLYSTYLGGSSFDSAEGIAVDGSGNVYVTGYTVSTDFPTENSFDNSPNGYDDVFVSKLSSSGNTLLYSTYLGGANHDFGASIVVDEETNVYITGYTESSNIPTVNAYDNSYNGGGDVFIAKLSPSTGGVNSLVYSTYLGDANYDTGESITVDENYTAYVTGFTDSTNFPTVNPYDNSSNGGEDAFVAKLSAIGNTLLYSTYLGGTSVDIGSGIAIDSYNNAYITGYTESTNFPTENAYDNSSNGGGDVFIAKLSPSTGGVNSLVYSTYLGDTNYDTGEGIAVDEKHNAYITGYTESEYFPMVHPCNGTYHGNGDAFIAKLSPNLSGSATLAYSTFLGGSDNDMSEGIALDKDANIYVTGYTISNDFPRMKPYDISFNGGFDVFIAFLFGNLPPNIPIVRGDVNHGYTNRNYTYTAITTDPEGDDIFYQFDWNDGTTTDWLGPFNSGQEADATHSWESPGTYRIIARAKDMYGLVSNWSSYPFNVVIDPPVILKISKHPEIYYFLTYPFYYYLKQVKASITNVGIENSGQVKWDIVLDYENNIPFKGDNSGIIEDIAPNETIHINSRDIFGIGKVNISYVALIVKTNDQTLTYDDGLTLVSYVLLKKNIMSQFRG